MTNLIELVLGLFLTATFLMWLRAMILLRFVEFRALHGIVASLSEKEHPTLYDATVLVRYQSEVQKGMQLLLKGPCETTRIFQHVLETGTEDTDSDVFDVRLHWPRYFGGIFVFIGLLGTVVGIAGAVGNLSDTIYVNSGNKDIMEQLLRLQDSIRGLLAGIKMASVSTALGISATIVVSMLNSWYVAQVNSLERGIRSCALDRLIPLYARLQKQRPTEATIFEQIKEALDKLTYVTTSASAAFTGMESSTRQMVALGNEIKSALGTIDTERAGLTTVGREVTHAVGIMTREVSNLSGEFARAQREQGAVQTELVQQLKDLYTNLQTLVRHFEVTLNDIGALTTNSPLRDSLLQFETTLHTELENLHTTMREAMASELRELNALSSGTSDPASARDGRTDSDNVTIQFHTIPARKTASEPTSFWQSIVSSFKSLFAKK